MVSLIVMLVFRKIYAFDVYKHLTKISKKSILGVAMEDNSILSRIGQSIKTLRNQKGWSQEKLSEVSKVDRTFIGKVERGEVNVSIMTLCEIARALNTTVKDLLCTTFSLQSIKRK